MLRYVVTATPRSGVGEARGGAGDRARSARSQGTRNLVAFTTRRYRTEPLVVSGPGAGAAVTAAGILNDIYSLHADVGSR